MASPQLTVQCHPKNKALCRIHRGSATSDHDHRFAYFAPDSVNSVYRYEWNTEQWEKLPDCEYNDAALVIIEGALTAVGGKIFSATNKLYTLQQNQWVEKYPPMKTARSQAAAVSIYSGDYIIVIGGGFFKGNDTVELFQVKNRQWYELTSLPQSLVFPSATICGNQVHVISGSRGAVGYSCSLQALPSSDEPITPQSMQHLISWTPLPPLPVTDLTAATLCGQLVTIGGDLNLSEVNTIHQLVEGQWVEIGSMTTTRKRCLVVSRSPNRIMIVGGWRMLSRNLNSVEECVAV